MARLLIARGANVNARDKAGYTPLLIAASIDFGDTAMMELLLASGADPRARNPEDKTDARHHLRHVATRETSSRIKLLWFRVANDVTVRTVTSPPHEGLVRLVGLRPCRNLVTASMENSGDLETSIVSVVDDVALNDERP